jgi:hypothetical protein
MPSLPMLPIAQSPGGYGADDHGQIWIEAQPAAAVSFLTLRTPCLGSWLGQCFAVNFSDKGVVLKILPASSGSWARNRKDHIKAQEMCICDVIVYTNFLTPS